MTTTAFDDQFTPATQTILRVNVIESQQQIHDLQTRLAAAIERAEKTEEKLTTARDDMQSWIDSRNGWMERAGAAEAELAKLREQEPFGYMSDENKDSHPDGVYVKREPWKTQTNIPLYAAPVPAPHPGATHCDDCGLTWLDDGLNPLGCPYCKNHASERNARRYLALRKVGVQVPGYDFVKFDWSLDAAADRLLGGGE